jgi:hypothetical protein
MRENFWLGGNIELPEPKWLIVAKYQYRITTSGIRGIRPYFPYLVIAFLAVYVTFLAPAIVALFVNDFLAFIITQAAIPMVQIILFMFFFYMMLFPISDTLREMQTNQLEIFLKAPVKPGDVLLGEFLGKMPFYAIVIVVITGTFTALMKPLGLDLAQNAIVIMTFVLTFLSALWIGTVISALLRTRLGKTVRGKDVGRALSIVIALPLIAVSYAILGGGLVQALVDPATGGIVRTILGLLPSSWGAEIFAGFVTNPGNIGAVGLETLTRFVGLVVFSVAVLWLGTRAANRAYSLELTTFIAPRARKDGLFYKIVRLLGGGGSSGNLLVSIFKDYGRRLENLSWIVYAVAVIAFLRIFLSDPYSKPEDPLISLSEMGIPFLTAFVVGTVSRGKETIFLYKKTPSGIEKFVKARLVQGLVVTIPIAAVLIVVSTVSVPQIASTFLLTTTTVGLLRTAASVVLVLGLALTIPIFSEGSRERALGPVINLIIVLFATIILSIELPRRGLSFGNMLPNLDRIVSVLYDHLLLTAIFFLVGGALLYVGTRKLSKIE